MKHVIGAKGKWFRLTCEKCMVNYIWFNKLRSIVEIWGPIHNLMVAHYAILSRINFLKERFIVDDCKSTPRNWPNDVFMELDLNVPDTFLDVMYIKYLIGKNGHNFKQITEKSGVSFIWYNSSLHRIQIWGLEKDIPDAINLIKDKINAIQLSL
jgi:hypothetical protein